MASRSRTTRRFPLPGATSKGDVRRRFRPSLMLLEPRTLLSTFTVTNTNDGGSGSLRDELGQAGDGDTVNFAASLFSSGAQTITLTSGVLAISKDVTIDGPGANLLTISGGHSQRVFQVTAGSSSQPVTLEGLTVANGSASNGGGLYNSGTLTMTACTVSGNSAFGEGGGILNEIGTLTMTACTVSGNSAGLAGNICNLNGTLTMTGCVISDGWGHSGAGGLLNVGTATLIGCAIYGNIAAATAGGHSGSGGAGASSTTGQ